MTLDLAIPDLATAHGSFLSALRGTGEDALLDFARDTLLDLVKAVGPETEEQGKSIVTGDILKVVRPIAPGDEAGEQMALMPVAFLVGRYRRSGRVSRAPKFRHNVRAADFREYEQRKHFNVGITAAGYMWAARELGISLPPWIAENQGEGDFEIEREGDHITVTVTNAVPWAAYLPGVMSRSGYAVQVKSGKLYDLAVEAMARAAAQTEF